MPTGDPRQATVITTWYPRGDELYFDETGQYQFVLKGSNCTASVRRTRLLRRVVEKSEPEPLAAEKEVEKKPAAEPTATAPAKKVAPSAAPPPPPARASHCASVGKAVSLEVTPKTKLMRVGETFEFQAIARDENGCRAAVETRWELLSGSFGKLTPSGTLSVPTGAPTGTLTLQASVEDKSVTVAARVVSEEEYEALIAGGEYGVMGESLEAASINLSTAHVEFDPQAPGEEEAERKGLLLLVAGLLGLLVVALLVLLRKKSARRDVRSHTEAPAEAERIEVPDATEPETPPPAEVRKPARLCPVCGRRYEDETMFCGEDGARLVRAN